MALDLSALNDEQLLPVMDTDGAVLVTAGAGSGKTRLLTHRIAHLICNLGAAPYNILAITFTNKAAREMKQRLENMLPDVGADEIFVSTFHAMCAYILRRFIDRLGYSRSFSIYDEDEKKKTIKAVAASVDRESDTLEGGITLALSRIKNAGMDIPWYEQTYKYLPDIDDITAGLVKYAEVMKNSSALDFDDLLYLTYKLLMADKEVREYLQDRFRYIHVDEFQDTNVIQYKLVKILSGRHGNIFVVGDEDQSIYGWRGANIDNIRDFITETGCRVYKLEQNYRSSKNIIALANAVIKNNQSRIEKNLWTQNGDGLKPQLFIAQKDLDEADFVMQTVKGLKANGNAYGSIAVLMRVNALSRVIEQKFMFYGVPYKLYGGFKFYDRKEIKDVLAYLKLLVNHKDNEAAMRIIAFPKKGIGSTSIDKMVALAGELRVQLYDVIMSAGTQMPISAKVKETLGASLTQKLILLSQKLTLLEQNKNLKVSMLVKFLYNLLELDEAFGGDTEDDENRKLNIKELSNSITETEKANPKLTLDEYVQQIMLFSDLDSEAEGDFVNLFTIHSAKGLEFDTVFIIGAEEGLFPLSRAMDSPDELEEERRLMYVALTRAKKRLFVSHTRERYMYGKSNMSLPSRFLTEAGLIKKEKREDYFSPNNHNQPQFQYGNQYGQRIAGGVSASPNPGSLSNPANQPAITQKLPQSTVNINDLKAGVAIKHKRLGKGIIKSVNVEGRQVDVEFETIGVLTLSIDFAPIAVVN